MKKELHKEASLDANVAPMKKCLLVLGMHRSGTSALTRMLGLLGAALPKIPIAADENNKSGYWEPASLNALHNQMLAEAGSRWDDWRAFDPAQLPEDRLRHYKAEISRLISDDFADAPLFVIKDPRICRFVPLYEEVLASLGASPLFVHSFRNPLAVISSLGKRDGMTEGFAGLLWLRHVLDSEAATRGKPRVFVSYEEVIEDWRPSMMRMREALVLDWPLEPDAAPEIEAYLTRDLQHHAPAPAELARRPEIAGWVKDAYAGLTALADDAANAAALAALGRVKAEFDAPAPVFGRAFFPELAAREMKHQAETDSLDASLADEQARRASAEVSLADLTVEKDALRLELDAMGEHLAKAAREKVQNAASLAAAQSQLTIKDEQIAAFNLELEKSSETANRLRSTVDEMLRSTSWQVTKPLRAIRRVLTTGKKPSAVQGMGAVGSDGLALRQEVQSTLDLGNTVDSGGDQTTAGVAPDPAFEALSSLYPLVPERGEVSKDLTKLIAFYLPQYHRVPENSEWWGPGFTEWTNVARGKPNFVGHHQPNIPRELGYYDLTHPDTMREQAALAKLYGIHAFCFYHYWFSGKRILERPVDAFLGSDIDINFCLCWANENWTRTWDGDTRSVLMEQKYAEGDAEAFIDSLIDSFRDPRYVRVDGKPLLLVYRAKDIPHPERWFGIWRERVREQGFPGLHIAVVDFYDISTPDEVDADSLVEFPPHKFNGPQNHPAVFPTMSNSNFAGGVIDYPKVIAQSAHRRVPPFKLFRGIMPSWDNTARRQDTPTIVMNARPDLYGAWLSYLRTYARCESPDETNRFIFINAWNEWGEGCYLEPDQRWGLSYLEHTLKSSYYEAASAGEQSLDGARELLFQRLGGVLAASRSDSEVGSAPGHVWAAGNIAAELSAHRAPSDLARRVSAALIKWPTLHKVAKLGYVSILRFRG